MARHDPFTAPMSEARRRHVNGPLQPMDDPREVSTRGTIRLVLLNVALFVAGLVAVEAACGMIAGLPA